MCLLLIAMLTGADVASTLCHCHLLQRMTVNNLHLQTDQSLAQSWSNELSSRRNGATILKVELRCGAVTVGRTYLFSASFVWRCLTGPGRGPVSTSLVAPSRSQAYEPKIPVKVREWISPAPAPPDFVFTAQPSAQPHCHHANGLFVRRVARLLLEVLRKRIDSQVSNHRLQDIISK